MFLTILHAFLSRKIVYTAFKYSKYLISSNVNRKSGKSLSRQRLENSRGPEKFHLNGVRVLKEVSAVLNSSLIGNHHGNERIVKRIFQEGDDLYLQRLESCFCSATFANVRELGRVGRLFVVYLHTVTVSLCLGGWSLNCKFLQTWWRR